MPYETHTMILAAKYLFYGIAGWGTIFYRRWSQRRKESAAQTWPCIEARVISSKAEHIEKTTRYAVSIQYSFYLTEYHYGEYHQEFNRESAADDFARNFRDKMVQVRYNPANPDQSVLEQSVVQQMVLLSPRLG